MSGKKLFYFFNDFAYHSLDISPPWQSFISKENLTEEIERSAKILVKIKKSKRKINTKIVILADVTDAMVNFLLNCSEIRVKAKSKVSLSVHPY